MAEDEWRSDESEEEEELPTLASLLQPSPSPSPPPLAQRGRLSSSPPAAAAAAAAAAEEVVVVSSESEDEDVEVVEIDPLPEGTNRREAEQEAGFEPFQLGCGDAADRGLAAAANEGPQETPVPFGDGFWGTRGAEQPLYPPPASPTDSSDQSLVSEESSETSPPPKKSKYSKKEWEEICRAAWQKTKEREAQRRQQEEEKKRKNALAKMLKARRPGECQKYISAVLDPDILQVDGGREILSALQAGNYSYVLVNQSVRCSITWRRKTASLQMGEGDEWTEEPNVLVLLRLEEFLSMVHNYKQEAQGYTEGKETLQSYVTHVMEQIPGKILTLAVVGVENSFRSPKVQSKKRLPLPAVNGNQEEEQRKQRKRKADDSELEITITDVKEALVDLQLSGQVHVNLFESWEEFGEFVTMFTKAVAEAPYKREQAKTEFPFYLEKEWRGGVKVDRSGKGLFEVWKRQIQQFNRVSLEVAEAIVSVYPSPQLLIQAYNRCSSEQERENMLADILVRRGDGVTATFRRVGPEISRRIYLQMTSYDPDLYLDFTG